LSRQKLTYHTNKDIWIYIFKNLCEVIASQPYIEGKGLSNKFLKRQDSVITITIV